MKFWLFMVAQTSILLTGFIVIAKDNLSRKSPIKTGEYQLYLDQDSIYIYDNSRKVGAYSYDSSKIFKALLNDNL